MPEHQLSCHVDNVVSGDNFVSNGHGIALMTTIQSYTNLPDLQAATTSGQLSSLPLGPIPPK